MSLKRVSDFVFAVSLSFIAHWLLPNVLPNITLSTCVAVRMINEIYLYFFVRIIIRTDVMVINNTYTPKRQMSGKQDLKMSNKSFYVISFYGRGEVKNFALMMRIYHLDFFIIFYNRSLDLNTIVLKKLLPTPTVMVLWFSKF